MRYTYTPQGICATEISFDINEDIITNVAFANGCNGNLQAVSRLVDGMTVRGIQEKCNGIICVQKGQSKGTSCADQLALAVEKAYLESTQGERRQGEYADKVAGVKNTLS
ncbi:MAG: TIGR03905 family TSCPD domain-containing protein [Spirochaetota bacterium]|jgi:uncharacterized protein (TIGR03905 family)|nr:TIGR03905 family TSCPD domain-containing protein [Spirochaetota bacterium]